MSNFSKFFAAGLACALIAAGTLAAGADAGTRQAPNGAGVADLNVALNPQPLPPGMERPDDDFFDFG
jgi:hypothetical protein